MNVCVLGAGGIIAPAIVRDLAESADVGSLVLLDRDGDAAKATAERHGLGRAHAAAVDAEDREALTLALDGCHVLVNAASYRVNLAAMDAALAAHVAYVDLGGLYHVSARQYAQHEAWEAAGQLAILGCGAGPGKTNVMAARAARELDEVHAIRCASAGLDEEGPSLPYALDTLRDELSEPPMAVRDGEPVALEPLADGGEVVFPEPIGARPTLHTLHSETLTLARSLGARDVDFRLALMPAVEDALRDPSAPPLPPASPRTWSAQHVEVTGMRDGEPRTVTATALTRPHRRWGIGGGIVSTGTAAAAAVRLLARGALAGPFGEPPAGVLAPERVLPPDAFFAELEPRGCTLAITTTSEVPT